MTDNSEKTNKIGYIFPILHKHISRVFDQEHPVFLKFTKLKTENCSKIVFYVSGKKLLIGDAQVENIERLDPNVVWSRYKDRLFLNEEEYIKYTKISPISKTKRKMKTLTIYELKNPRRYKNPIESIFPVTPSGRYLTQEMVRKIRSLT